MMSASHAYLRTGKTYRQGNNTDWTLAPGEMSVQRRLTLIDEPPAAPVLGIMNKVIHLGSVCRAMSKLLFLDVFQSK